MRRRSFRAVVGASVVGVAAAVSLSLPAVASPAASSPTSPASAHVDVTTAIGRIQVDARNTTTGPGAATGTFVARGDVLPLTGPGLGPITQLGNFTLSGPVTCLDVQGSRAGLIYPVTGSSGPAKVFQGSDIYITVQAATPTAPASIGFLGPIPSGSVKSCPPLVPFLVAQSGTATLTPAG